MELSDYLEYMKKDVLLTYYNRNLGGDRNGHYIIMYAQSIEWINEDTVKIYPYCMFQRVDSISTGLKTFKLYTPFEGTFFVCNIKSLFEPKEKEMKEMYIAWKTEYIKKTM